MALNGGDYWTGNTVVTSSGTNTSLWNGSYTNSAVTIYTGGGSGYSDPPAPRPKTALEWLDAEIETTCKLARQAA